MGKIFYPGIPARYDLVPKANKYATAQYLTWSTGLNFEVCDVDRLIQTGKIALDKDGSILTSSVKTYVSLGEGETVTPEQLKVLAVEIREAVLRMANLMVRQTLFLERMAVKSCAPEKKTNASKPRKC